ncbi:MAG TPA: GDSL-type esterase/lipase family protein [Mucilaginibacter sp.]|nr:GDSL-type esterase/lipase family protein [Mucilaginibacter sp.]
MIIIAFRCAAQSNNDFEQGLTGWITKGKVTIDHDNAQKGKSCVKIGPGYGMVMQRIKGNPLAVVQFNVFVKTSDSTVKGHAFIRFLDINHKQLMIFKSGPVRSATYQQTGNYVEAPPFTSYIEIGIERDSSDIGNVYVDNFSIDTHVGEPKVKHKSMVNEDQYMHPFWKSDTIYNETVLFYSKDGKAADGRFLYTANKILSVKKFDLTTTYKPGIDYILNGNVITRKENSAMLFRADTWFDTKKDLAWYNLQSQWVLVTYTHHDKWDGPVPEYKGGRMPKVMAKLKAKAPVKIAAYGMSITRGMDVSSYDTVPPYMPTYVSLFTNRLKKAYHYNNIKLYNAALPGSIVDWGAQYAEKYINPIKPDLLIIDFGMNDFWRYTPEQFKGYIQTIIKKVKAGNPNVEFVLLSNMKFDPDYVLDSDSYKEFYVSNLTGYSRVLKDMEADGIVNLDMNTLSGAIYSRKKAKDCIANPLHPNDYLARWYAQGLAQLLIKNFK